MYTLPLHTLSDILIFVWVSRLFLVKRSHVLPYCTWMNYSIHLCICPTSSQVRIPASTVTLDMNAHTVHFTYSLNCTKTDSSHLKKKILLQMYLFLRFSFQCFLIDFLFIVKHQIPKQAQSMWNLLCIESDSESISCHILQCMSFLAWLHICSKSSNVMYIKL